MDIYSTKKPDVPKKPEVQIEFNNKFIESFTSNGFADAIPRSVKGPRDRMKMFLNKVDLRKGPLERTVRMIVRLKAPDWNSEKHERKEWVVTTAQTCRKWSPIMYPPIAKAIEKVKFTCSSPCHLFNIFSQTYPIAHPRATVPNIEKKESEIHTIEKAEFANIIPIIT